MARMGENFICIGPLDNESQVHNCDLGAYVLDYAEIVGDEQVVR